VIFLSVSGALNDLIMHNFIRSFIIGCDRDKLEFPLIVGVVQDVIRVVTEQCFLAIFVADFNSLELFKYSVVKFLETENFTISLLLPNKRVPLFLAEYIEEFNILSFVWCNFLDVWGVASSHPRHDKANQLSYHKEAKEK
jgi:hypothetical protein